MANVNFGKTRTNQPVQVDDSEFYNDVVEIVNAGIEEGDIQAGGLSVVLTFSDGHSPSTSGSFSVRTHSWTSAQLELVDITKPLFVAYDYEDDNTADIPIAVINYDDTQLVYLDYGRGTTSTRVKIIQ